MLFKFLIIFIAPINGMHLTAGEDYTPGPYLVTFRRGSRTSNEFSVSITKDEDDIYTGNKNFNLTIVGDLLPFGLALGDIVSVNVTIVDDECKYQNVVKVLMAS